jgi:hypothetical protein
MEDTGGHSMIVFIINIIIRQGLFDNIEGSCLSLFRW